MNKITFTKQMLSAPLGETIYKIDWKLHKGMKQSIWRKYRVVCITTGRDCAANRKYKIEETDLSGFISFTPQWLGGYGILANYNEMFWCRCDTEVESYNTHQEAVDRINKMIQYVYDYENREEDAVLEEIVSWHPE